MLGARRFLHCVRYYKDHITVPPLDKMPSYKSVYQPIRDELDYKYHTRPTPLRTIVQDKFIANHLTGSYSTSETPLLMFTAGAMGAGKSHYLSTLPYQFILIDPDEIAATIPEFAEIGSDYTDEFGKLPDAEKNSRHRHEARLITEILLRLAMQRDFDIVIDGSLRSYQWYLREIPILRERYPQYHVELVHIHAPLNEVLSRAAKRASKTGRIVPNSLIERSWKDSRRAISVLGRKKIVDRVQMVDSSGSSPLQIYDSDKDPEWPVRGVPNDISRVDKFLDAVVENGEDIAEQVDKMSCKL